MDLCVIDQWCIKFVERLIPINSPYNADEKKFMESYQNLLHLFEMPHIDNMKVLKALICAKDDLQPLVDGATKKRVCSHSP